MNEMLLITFVYYLISESNIWLYLKATAQEYNPSINRSVVISIDLPEQYQDHPAGGHLNSSW